MTRSEEHLKQTFGSAEITPGIRNLLLCLFDEEGVTISEVAGKLGVAKSTMTSLVEKTRVAGYLTTAKDTKDRRAVRLFLTEQAQPLREPLTNLRNLLSNEIGKNLSDQDQESLGSLLEKLGNASS
ncbi:MAG: MarR family winged helix-turn-helix transcriptional regulator [Verrucomicrobiota bacterium]